MLEIIGYLKVDTMISLGDNIGYGPDSARKYIINAGSVGQPRNPAAGGTDGPERSESAIHTGSGDHGIHPPSPCGGCPGLLPDRWAAVLYHEFFLQPPGTHMGESDEAEQTRTIPVQKRFAMLSKPSKGFHSFIFSASFTGTSNRPISCSQIWVSSKSVTLACPGAGEIVRNTAMQASGWDFHSMELRERGYDVNDFAVSENGIVTDRQTGLVW